MFRLNGDKTFALDKAFQQTARRLGGIERVRFHDHFASRAGNSHRAAGRALRNFAPVHADPKAQWVTPRGGGGPRICT